MGIDFAKHANHIGFHAYVALKSRRLAASRFDIRHHLVGGVAPLPVVDRNRVAPRAGNPRRRRANSACPTGNQQYASHVVSPQFEIRLLR